MALRSIYPASGNGAVTVSMPNTPRWIPAYPFQQNVGSLNNQDAAAPWTGSWTRWTFPVYASSSRLAMGTWNTVPNINVGETFAGSAAPTNIRLNNSIEAALQRASTNLGRFQWQGANNKCVSDGSFRLSEPLAIAVTKDETLAVRYGCDKFDTSVNSQRPNHRTTDRHANLARNVTTDVSAYVGGTSTDTGTGNGMGDPVFLEVTDGTLRAVLIQGSSIGFGGNGWIAANQQNGLPLSASVQGATSGAELTAYQNGTATGQTGMVFSNQSESASNLFQRYKTVGYSASQYRPGRFRQRDAEEQQIGYTDTIISFWVNECSATMSGFNINTALDAFESAARQIIKKNIALDRRTWFFIEGNQTTWTGGGTPWDLGLSDTAYQDGQTPASNGVTNITSYRNQMLARLDAVCKQLGSAWIFDTGKVTQTLNSRGELVWKKGPSGVQPTSSNDGTHPNQANCYAIRDAAVPFFGGRNATTFPAFGLLNP